VGQGEKWNDIVSNPRIAKIERLNSLHCGTNAKLKRNSFLERGIIIDSLNILSSILGKSSSPKVIEMEGLYFSSKQDNVKLEWRSIWKFLALSSNLLYVKKSFSFIFEQCLERFEKSSLGTS
jgi:hypothetical protein